MISHDLLRSVPLHISGSKYVVNNILIDNENTLAFKTVIGYTLYIPQPEIFKNNTQKYFLQATSL